MTKSYWEIVQAVQDLETAREICRKLNENFTEHYLQNLQKEVFQYTKGKPLLTWMLTASDSDVIGLKHLLIDLANSEEHWQLAKWKNTPPCSQPEWADQVYILVREVKGSDMWVVLPCGTNLIEYEFGYITSPKTAMSKKNFKLVDRV